MADETAPNPAAAGSPKPGWKTTEFWLAFAAQLVSLVMLLGLPEDKPMMKIAALAGAVLVKLGYDVSRGWVKDGAKPGYKSTEFLLTAANLAVGTIAASGVIKDPSHLLQAAGVVSALAGGGTYALSRGLAKKE